VETQILWIAQSTVEKLKTYSDCCNIPLIQEIRVAESEGIMRFLSGVRQP